jgi:serine phosphatase RsbU (regulator of sigma subunit)
MFGEKRVVDLVREESASSAEQLLQRIVDEVTAFSEGAPQNDDMTLLIVKRH